MKALLTAIRARIILSFVVFLAVMFMTVSTSPNGWSGFLQWHVVLLTVVGSLLMGLLPPGSRVRRVSQHSAH